VSASLFINAILCRAGLQLRHKTHFAALDSLFYRYYAPGFFFVQIGANDGKRADPIQHLVKRHRLSGLAVEPLGDMFAELRKTYAGYPVALANVAIHRSERQVTLHRVRPGTDVPDWAHGIASLDPEFYKHSGAIRGEDMLEEVVPACTLQQLLDSHSVTRIDLFAVDTEGYDPEILAMLLETEFRPHLIVFEHGLREGAMSVSAFKDISGRLMDEGYLVLPDYADAIAYRMQPAQRCHPK
jgi:FkbM family methyltransferase